MTDYAQAARECLPCRCVFQPQDNDHEADCPAHYRDAVADAIQREVEKERERIGDAIRCDEHSEPLLVLMTAQECNVGACQKCIDEALSREREAREKGGRHDDRGPLPLPM